jgi:hypothetical protein
VGLVDEPVDLVEGPHDLQEQDGEGQDLAVGDRVRHEQVEREGDDQQVEGRLIQRLAAAEQRHLEVVAELLGPLLCGDLLHAPGLLTMGVGDADVVEARELLDDRAVHDLAAPHQPEADAPLRGQLPQRQHHRHRRDAGHDQRDPRLLRQGRPQREGPHQDRRQKSRKLRRSIRTNPPTLRKIRPCRAPTCSWVRTAKSTCIRCETSRTHISLSICVQVFSTR